MHMHTPGPWTVDGTVALGAYGVWTDYPVNPGHDGAGYPIPICSFAIMDKNIDRETRNENARLIAAAPEMLAACKAVLPRLIELRRYREERAGTDWANDFAEAESQLRAAIAKAQGGAP